VIWSRVEASRPVLDPISYKDHPNDNVIILYYDAKIEMSKNARVTHNAVQGPFNPGTNANPVPVELNDTVTYNFDLLNPRAKQDAPGGPSPPPIPPSAAPCRPSWISGRAPTTPSHGQPTAKSMSGATTTAASWALWREAATLSQPLTRR